MEGNLSSRAVLSLRGEDATSFLQGLVTQDVASEKASFAALLTPQGKILFDFFMVPVEGGYLLDCAAASAPSLLKRLSMYKLRAKVTLAHEAGLSVFIGPAPAAFAQFSDPRLPALPVRRIGPPVASADADEAYDLLRLSLGVPEFGREFAGDEVFLLDVNYDLLGAVSYKKGCFIGQEVTSRMKRKGEVRKRTLIAAGSSLAKGEAVMAGGLAIGEILSVRSQTGLALIRIDRLAEATAVGEPLTVAGGPVAISSPAYMVSA